MLQERATPTALKPRGGLILLATEVQALGRIEDGLLPLAARDPRFSDSLDLLERFGLIAEQGQSYEVTERGKRLLAADPTYRTGGFYRYELADLLP